MVFRSLFDHDQSKNTEDIVFRSLKHAKNYIVHFKPRLLVEKAAGNNID